MNNKFLMVAQYQKPPRLNLTYKWLIVIGSIMLWLQPINASAITTTSNNADTTTTNDPWESYNRTTYKMNSALDNNIVRPTSVWYTTYIPYPIRTGITNFYNNLRDFVTLGNDILQLKVIDSMQTTMRIALNSTFGICGLIDISSAMGLNMHKNSFGGTLKIYGWKTSGYFVIPFFGPSTVRDALGMIPDLAFNPLWWLITDYYVSTGIFITASIDTRAKFLDVDQLIYTSLDPYATMRDLYLQNLGQIENNITIDHLLNE